MAATRGEVLRLNQSRLIPSRAFLELRQRIASEPDVPAPHSWAAEGSKTPGPSAEGAGWPRSRVAATGSGLLRGSDQPQAFSLKKIVSLPRPPELGKCKRGPRRHTSLGLHPTGDCKMRHPAETAAAGSGGAPLQPNLGSPHPHLPLKTPDSLR